MFGVAMIHNHGWVDKILHLKGNLTFKVLDTGLSATSTFS